MKVLFCIALVLVLAGCQKKDLVPPQVLESISTIQSKYAPDKRTSIFNVQVIPLGGKFILKGETNHAEAKAEVLKVLSTDIYIDSVEILPSISLQGSHFGIITIPVANMRSNPSHSSELSNQLLSGTVVRNFKKINGWIYCQTPDDYLGWIDQDAIQMIDSTELSAWLNRAKIIITQDQTYLFRSPSKSSEVMSTMTAGSIVATGDDHRDFYEVFLPDGRTGYIPGAHAKDFKLWKVLQSKNKNSAEILKTAYSYMGRPYLWGGTSGNGMDCSGFTKTVFFQHGLLLPRDASQQANVGMPVETDTTLINLQPGDFLFFGRHATPSTPEKVTHVAIYAGNGKIIHASGYIREQSLIRTDSTFTEQRLLSLLKATRPLASPKEHGIPLLSDLKYFN